MDELLIPALRQYRHNRDEFPGLVVGFDKAETEKVVATLRRAGYVLAMRLLQSDLVIDDVERAAMGLFLSRATPSEEK